MQGPTALLAISLLALFGGAAFAQVPEPASEQTLEPAWVAAYEGTVRSVTATIVEGNHWQQLVSARPGASRP